MSALIRVRRRFARLSALAVIGSSLCLVSCGSPQAPEVEGLESFDLEVPDAVAASAPFTITVVAVGDKGSRPLSSFTGQVALSVSTGTITPSSVTLENGTGTATVSVGPDEGTVTLEVTAEGLMASASLSVGPVQFLAGAPSGPAVEAIPDETFVANPAEYVDDHPGLPGLAVSYRTALITLSPTATVGDVNDLLQGSGAALAGGTPGSGGRTSGLLIVRFPFTSHAEMDAMLAELDTSEVVLVATPDNLKSLPALPGAGGPFDWLWDGQLLADGNWGLEISRVPQMWNLNAVLRAQGDRAVDLGIYDNGYFPHPDLALATNASPNEQREHGTHVAGIVGASFDNGLGTDGVTPFARLRVAGDSVLSTANITQGIKSVVRAGARVVNLSIATDWEEVHPDDAPARLALERKEAVAFQALHATLVGDGPEVLVVAASGNDSDFHGKPVLARHGSPWAIAALENGFGDVIVVEAVGLDTLAGTNTVRPEFSNPGGHVSAPGVAILSTIGDSDYDYRSGTSMAAPFVTGLVGYLLSVEPTLSNGEILDILTRTGVPVDPFGGIEGSDRVDAFGAVLDIDRVRANDRVLRMLLDIDDGTPDGNLRVDPAVPGVDYLETDADGNGVPGDGSIDMSDFRRWRDLYLQFDEVSGLTLDGSENHPKRDLNANGLVASDPDENLYPVADFNGDGVLSPLETVEMSGYLEGTGPLTDLEVLQALFDDPDHSAEELSDLLESGDVHVDLEDWLAVAGPDDRLESAIGFVDAGSFTALQVRSHDDSEPLEVYTTVSLELPNRFRAWALNAVGDTVCAVSTDLAVRTGEDGYWAPRCGVTVVVEITLPGLVEPGTPSPLLVRAGIQGGESAVRFLSGLDIDLLVSGGSAAATRGTTDVDGFFETEVTMAADAPEMHVFATVTDLLSGASATAEAVALPLVNTGRVFMIENASVASAQASAAGTCAEGTRTTTPASDDLDFSISHSCSGTAQGEEHASSVSLVGTMTFDIDSLTSELAGATLTATGTAWDTATGLSGSLFGVFLDVTFQVADAPVLLSVSGTALTSHMENDGGGGAGSFVLIANPGGVGGDAANIFLVRDRGPGYSIELDRTLTLEPGRYRISARLDNDRGSSEIDFGFDVGPQGAR